jgi:hypothetical protein
MRVQRIRLVPFSLLYLQTASKRNVRNSGEWQVDGTICAMMSTAYEWRRPVTAGRGQPARIRLIHWCWSEVQATNVWRYAQYLCLRHRV